MSYLRIRQDGTDYPYNLTMLRAAFPNTSFPREMSKYLLAEFGVFKVEPTARPARTLTQDPVEQAPQQIDGVWTQVWAMVDVSPEVAAERQRRAADQADAESVKADAFVQNFIAMTPAQVTAYIENNTASLAQTRALLNKMALMLLAVARQQYR